MKYKTISFFIIFLVNISKHFCVFRKISEESRKTDTLLKPVEFDDVISSLRIFPFVYYGYISRLSLSNLDSNLVEKRLQEIYPFLSKKECGILYCLFITKQVFYNPNSGSEMTVTALSWVLSFSTLSSNVLPILLQYSEGLSQAIFFAKKLSLFEIIIYPVVTIEEGEVFASIKSPDNEQDDYTEELLISPCKGVLQYVWPNVSTPSIAFMLIARVQCSKLKKSEDQAEIQNYELYG